MKYSNRRNVMDTKVLVKASFLTAISIVLTRFLYYFVPLAGGVPAIRLSIGEVPIMMSGMLFGPVVGGITGLAADLIGVMVNAQGTIHPGFMLSSLLWGLIPGLIFIIFRKKKKYDAIYSVLNISVTVVICFIIISLALNTLWLSNLYKISYMLLLPGRVIVSFIMVPVQSIIIVTLIRYLKSVINS